MRGMKFKFVIVHHDGEGNVTGEDAFPVAGAEWDDVATMHMRRIGGATTVKNMLSGLLDEVRRGTSQALIVLSSAVLNRYENEAKAIREAREAEIKASVEKKNG